MFQPFISMEEAGTAVIAFLIAGTLVFLYVMLKQSARAWWEKRKGAPVAKPRCPKETDHVWRAIAAPYARQCRKCGVVTYREDKNGEFPDGLREYLDDMAAGLVCGKCGLTHSNPVTTYTRAQLEQSRRIHARYEIEPDYSSREHSNNQD